MKEWTDKEWAEVEWLKKSLRDYYKPRLKRDLQRTPNQEEVDRRFREIYPNLHFTLLVGRSEGVSVQFHEIAKFTLEEFNEFRVKVEEYLIDRFGGGWFKLNIYEGPTFAMTVNYKPKGQPKWEGLLS
tara:strand:- start:241 stop:624 length:384 start_codon:yes stop_codon:yes gene_type:complete